MNSHVNEPSGENLTGESSDTQMKKRNGNLHVGFDTVAWQKITENDSSVRFKVGKSSSSSSPDTPDIGENLNRANKAGDCSLKAAAACRLVADIAFDAIDVGNKLLEDSLRKGSEIDFQGADNYVSFAEKYRTAIDIALEKAREADGAARVARTAGDNALKIAKRLSELSDIELGDAKEVNFQAIWAKTTAEQATNYTYKITSTAFEAIKPFWREICDVRNMELNFNRNLDKQSGRNMKFVNVVLILLLFIGCLLVVLKNFWKIVGDSDASMSVGITFIIGSLIACVAINAHYSKVESVAHMEKIRKAMAPVEKSLHRLEKCLKKNKFLELSDWEEESKSE